MPYVPLRAASGYSLLRSALRLEDYVRAGMKAERKALALCDLCSLGGAPLFVRLCENAGIKPLLGTEMTIEEHAWCFFVINEEGYENILDLLYLAQTKTLTLKEAYERSKGLITILSCADEKLLENYRNLDPLAFARYLLKLTEGFDEFLIGIDHTVKDIDLSSFKNFLQERNYETVAFPKIRYLKKEDAIALSILEAIENDAKSKKTEETGPFYLLSDAELNAHYAKEELEMSQKIADECTFTLFQRRGAIIPWPTEPGENSADHLKEAAYKGLRDKGLLNEKYEERLENELSVITRMGYPDYFLIVQDYVNFARSRKIPVGPGRGSAAGSLTAFALGIVEVDPIRHGLYFERFLNEGRKSLPDIDLDVSDTRRHEVIEYLKERWGKERTANIVTYQTILARQALRDIGRVYDYPERDIDLLSSLIHDPKLSLRATYRKERRFRELIDSDRYYLKIVALASKIEGLARQKSIHAAGIVLNKTPLRKVLPVSVDAEGNLIEQFEMDCLEEMGFLKMDILGLRNLTIIDDCLRLIKEKQGLTLKEEELPMNDQAALDLIACGKTAGIFQLESPGMQRSIKILKPSTFEDIVALLALYRPGPMKNIPLYARRKEGKEKLPILPPVLEKILAPTYGIIVYQEQIIRIAHLYAGLSLGEADLFRRAISKKDKATLLRMKNVFLEGAVSLKRDKDEALKVFELIERFAAYGFNRSHSLSYAIISLRMAYLKAHAKAAFYCALLNDGGSEQDRLFYEMREEGLRLLSPDINEASNVFTIKDEALIVPLTMIKGLFQATVMKIINERNKSGPYEDLFSFVLRLHEAKIRSEEILALIDAGAFLSLHPSRASLRKAINKALIYAEMMSDEKGSLILDPSLYERPTLTEEEDDLKTDLLREGAVLGLILSSSLEDLLTSKEAKPKITLLMDLGHVTDKVTVLVFLKNIRIIKTKQGEDMAFLTCLDGSGEGTVVIFPSVYQECQTLLKKDSLLLIEGRYETKRATLTAEKITLGEKQDG